MNHTSHNRSGVFAPGSPLRAAVMPSRPVARTGVTPTLPRAKTKRKTKKTTRTVPDDTSPWVSTAEGASIERESAAPRGPRTRLGEGVGKAAGTRIAWAQRLRRRDRVEERLSNGYFKSTTHRVVNPGHSHDRRFSMPFFIHPRHPVTLDPRPSAIARTGGRAAFEPIAAGAYLEQRLRDIGLGK